MALTDDEIREYQSAAKMALCEKGARLAEELLAANERLRKLEAVAKAARWFLDEKDVAQLGRAATVLREALTDLDVDAKEEA